jgi:putative flavoprotein involved in K+ transport
MGELRATRVILATGAYQRPYRPTVAPGFGRDLLVIDVAEYRNPGGLPPGDVLVVGSGQSGCQIAEELHESGRRVVLSCGRTPWAPSRIAGRDVIWWAIESGFLDVPVSSLPDPAARLVSTILTTGHGGGHDLHLRTLRALGVELVGHLRGADGGAAYFDRDLGESAAWGDERCRELIAQFAKMASERGLGRIDPVELSPFDPTSPSRLSLRGFGTVIFAGGFRPAYRDWLPWPDAFDALGFPIVSDGASTVIDGLYFVGTHFLRKRKSGLLFGVGEDAAIVAATVAHGVESSASSVR